MIRLVHAAPDSARLSSQQVAGYAGPYFAESELRSRVVVKDGPLGKGEIR